MPLMLSRICEGCGREFTAEARRVRAGRGRNCSRSCHSRGIMRRRHLSGGQHGALNPNWRGGRSDRPYESYVKAFKLANPEKARAHRLVFAAVQSGVLVRPAVCSRCAIPCRAQAHHEDYSQPLQVEWLCKRCHVAADKARQEAA